MPSPFAFLAVAAVVIVTPGPDTALTIRNTLLGGRRAGVFTAFGVALGQTTWTIVTSAGLAALLLASEPIFRAVRYAGAAYLVLLGVQALRAAVRADARPRGGRAEVRGLSPVRALRQGLLSNLTNPKMLAFFPALLPQFAPAGSFAALMLLGLVFASMTAVWLSLYAVAASSLGRALARGRARRVLEAGSGTVLIALGVRLAMDRR